MNKSKEMGYELTDELMNDYYHIYTHNFINSVLKEEKSHLGKLPERDSHDNYFYLRAA
jgi:hypothetical protein